MTRQQLRISPAGCVMVFESRQAANYRACDGPVSISLPGSNRSSLFCCKKGLSDWKMAALVVGQKEFTNLAAAEFPPCNRSGQPVALDSFAVVLCRVIRISSERVSASR